MIVTACFDEKIGPRARAVDYFEYFKLDASRHSSKDVVDIGSSTSYDVFYVRVFCLSAQADARIEIVSDTRNACLFSTLRKTLPKRSGCGSRPRILGDMTNCFVVRSHGLIRLRCAQVENQAEDTEP